MQSPATSCTLTLRPTYRPLVLPPPAVACDVNQARAHLSLVRLRNPHWTSEHHTPKKCCVCRGGYERERSQHPNAHPPEWVLRAGWVLCAAAQISEAQALAPRARCQVQHERERDADEHVELVQGHAKPHVNLAVGRLCRQGCAICVVTASLLPLHMRPMSNIRRAVAPAGSLTAFLSARSLRVQLIPNYPWNAR